MVSHYGCREPWRRQGGAGWQISVKAGQSTDLTDADCSLALLLFRTLHFPTVAHPFRGNKEWGWRNRDFCPYPLLSYSGKTQFQGQLTMPIVV